MKVGQGKYSYELAEGWEQIPAGWRHGDVVNVAIDSRDRVYAFNRSEHPVMVYERDGTFVGSWGEGVFTRPHGITISKDVVYCTDDKDHTVRKFTLEGELLRTIGTPGKASDTGFVDAGTTSLASVKRGAGPFNRPTRVFEAPTGDFYVTDGYGNARVHRFDAAWQLIGSWGEPGEGPGQFNLPHSLWVTTDGRVWVCDRENDRVQLFSPTGEFLTMWTNCTKPADIVIDEAEGVVYLGELAWVAGTPSMAGRPITENRPSQVSVRDMDGNVLSRWGGPDPWAPGSFGSAHGITVDSHGDIYVAEVAETALGRIGKYRPEYPSLSKFVRVR
jgi:DNA-binding beta-propeller fold protein YncE